MDTSILVENGELVETLNSILHEYGEYIIGRMSIPYRKRGDSIISIALDALQNGKLFLLIFFVNCCSDFGFDISANRGVLTIAKIIVAVCSVFSRKLYACSVAVTEFLQ